MLNAYEINLYDYFKSDKPDAADGVYGFSMDGDDLYILLLCGAV